MIRIVLPLLLILLAACDAATTGLRDVPAVPQQIDGASFAVYRKGDLAQAVRTNRQFAPRIGPLAGQAAVAMQQATGCKVTDLAGDAAVLTGRLDCSGRPRPACDVDAVLKGARGASMPVTRRCTRS